MAATTITVSQETRKLLEGLKTWGATYDDVIRGLLIALRPSSRWRNSRGASGKESLIRSRNTSPEAASSPTERSVSFRLESIEEADTEFLALPPGIREVFISAFREIAAGDSPVALGPGWSSEELRRRQRVAAEGLDSLHVGELWRGVYFRSGESLVFLAFGFRLPGFYDKLGRLRKALTARCGTAPGPP